MASLVSAVENLFASIFNFFGAIFNTILSLFETAASAVGTTVHKVFDLFSGLVGFVLGMLPACSVPDGELRAHAD